MLASPAGNCSSTRSGCASPRLDAPISWAMAVKGEASQVLTELSQTHRDPKGKLFKQLTGISPEFSLVMFLFAWVLPASHISSKDP